MKIERYNLSQTEKSNFMAKTFAVESHKNKPVQPIRLLQPWPSPAENFFFFLLSAEPARGRKIEEQVVTDFHAHNDENRSSVTSSAVAEERQDVSPKTR